MTKKVQFEVDISIWREKSQHTERLACCVQKNESQETDNNSNKMEPLCLKISTQLQLEVFLFEAK